MQLEQGVCRNGPQYHKIKKWLDYAACPVIWDSKLQSQVVLSNTKAEYIAMFMALCNDIPHMELIQQTRQLKFDIVNIQPYIYCKVFKDNSGVLELARLLRLPSTYQAHQHMLQSLSGAYHEGLNQHLYHGHQGPSS